MSIPPDNADRSATRRPRAGDVLSYSAGSQALQPYAFRQVPREADRSREILQRFPALRERVGEGPLLIVSCYPAFLGFFGSAVFLDTYLRQENLSRGLLLAAREAMACCVAGQPLAVLDLLMGHRRQGLAVPERLLMVLGGYHCPVSLQRALEEGVAPVAPSILFAYGMAEIDFACLAGHRPPGHPLPLYQPVVDGVGIELEGDALWLCDRRGGAARRHATGDTAAWQGAALAIRPGPGRADPAVLDALEGWTPADWRRRTGHLARAGGRMVWQLRRGMPPQHPAELEFHEFARRHEMEWSRKPAWR